jgi:excisionase family DNA binding protein
MHTTDPSTERKFFTVAQFCARYQVSRSTTYRLAHQGALNIVKCGRASRILASEAEAWRADLAALGR